MSTKFNPGPWSADEPIRGSVLVRSRGCVIAEVIPQGTAAANARLIAAAPDMYGALKGLLGRLSEGPLQSWSVEAWTEEIRAVLAKAEAP